MKAYELEHVHIYKVLITEVHFKNGCLLLLSLHKLRGCTVYM